MNNKLRAFLTTLCIIIGITMVTIVDAVTTGMDESFDNSMAMLGQNVVYIEKWPWADNSKDWWEIIGRKEMELSYVDFLEERSQLASNVAAGTQRNVSVRLSWPRKVHRQMASSVRHQTKPRKQQSWAGLLITGLIN